MAPLGVQQIPADHFYIREESSFPGLFAPGKPLLLRAPAILVRSVSQKFRLHCWRTGVLTFRRLAFEGSLLISRSAGPYRLSSLMQDLTCPASERSDDGFYVAPALPK